MKKKEIWKKIKYDHFDQVVLMKYGNFYKAFETDAYIIWQVMGYKIIECNHVGFPLTVVNEVVKKINEKQIDCIVYNDKNEYIEYSVPNNNYFPFLDECYEKYKLFVRIDKVLLAIRLQISDDNELLNEYERKLGIFNN